MVVYSRIHRELEGERERELEERERKWGTLQCKDGLLKKEVLDQEDQTIKGSCVISLLKEL